MKLVTLDFETYYSTEYSLSRLTTEEYIRDPQFEVIGVGAKIDDGEAMFYTGTKVAEFLATLHLEDCAVLCHNTVFDGAILGWVFGIHPKLLLDTLSMARAIHSVTVGMSLGALANYYSVGTKGDEVVRALGKRRKDFTPDEIRKYGDYCKTDCDLTYAVFQKMKSQFPVSELMLIDQTLRMFTRPTLQLDGEALALYLQQEISRKQEILDSLGEPEDVRKVLMSNPKFAALLESLGVRPPTKLSKATDKLTYAFAKTDKGLKDLLQHNSPLVRTVVAARLGVKSSIEETRAKRLLDISERGSLPVQLRYYGAHTGRFSGDGKINLQNLRRGGDLRRAVIAPDGYKVVACDSSQIEARIVAYLAGERWLVEAFRQGRDVYSEFASTVYDREVTKSDQTERHVGKTAILGLGYNMGAARFQDTLTFGPVPVNVTIGEAERIVRLYRSRNSNIVKFWKACGAALAGMAGKQTGMITPMLAYDADGITLPNQLRIQYPALTGGQGDRGTSYTYINNPRAYRVYIRNRVRGNNPEPVPTRHIYGGMVTENVTQALARIVVTEQLVEIGQHYPVALQVHDEVVCVVPDSEVDACRAMMERVMSTPPKWAPDLPVACEAGVGQNYGEAK